MSEVGTILDAWLSEVGDAIAGVTTYRGIKAWEDIGVGEFPFAMAYDPAGTTELLDHRQEKRSVAAVIEIVGSNLTDETLLTWLDDIRTQVAGNRTLGAVVDWAWVDGFAVTPEADERGMRALVLSVFVEEVV